MGTVLGTFLFIGIPSILYIRGRVISGTGEQLLQNGRLAAPFIDVEALSSLQENEEASGQEYETIQNIMRKVERSLQLPADSVAILRPSENNFMIVSVRSGTAPAGKKIAITRTMRKALQTKEGSATWIFREGGGGWIAAYAPIRDGSGKTIALLEIKKPYNIFQSRLLEDFLTLSIGIVFLLLILFIVTMVIARKISRPLKTIVERMETIAAGTGDLTIKMHLPGTDEIARTGTLIDSFIESMAQTLRQVIKLSDVAEKSVHELREMTRTIQEKSQKEAEIIEITNASNDELAASLEEISGNTSQQEKIVKETVPSLEDLMNFILVVQTNATRVNAGLQEATRQIGDGRLMINGVADVIEKINSSSSDIENIVEVIQGISDQVALLSLNASIEAARAGEYGRGFAVVAEEISKLSENTANQIKDISDIVTRNRRDTMAAVEQIQKTENVYNAIEKLVVDAEHFSGMNAKKAALQKEPAEKGIKALQEIEQKTRVVAASIREQTNGTEEVARNMNTMMDMGEQLSLTINRAHSQVSEMEEQVHILNELLHKIRV